MPEVSTQAEPPLLGRHAVVTGAGRGIGSATARELARLGATLTLMGRTAEPLERLAADLPRMAGRPDPHVELLDVTEPTTVQSAFEHAVGERGPVHVLVNNAGGVESAPFRRTDAPLWHRMLALNLDGPFHCAAQVVPSMVTAGDGRIVNVASTAGLRGYPYVSAYCAAKHGLVGFTRALARELAGSGVTVNAVCPGYTDTDLVTTSVERIAAATRQDRTTVRGELVRTNPSGRLVRPEEVAVVIGWQVDGPVATLMLDRPERKNPLTFESYAELRDTFRALGAIDTIHAVVLHGAGGNFSSGGDVFDIIGPLVQMDLPGKLRFTEMTGDLLKAMRHCPQPIVAAVDGVCAGAGAILAMGADLRLGTARSRVAFLFNRVGLSGADMGACAILPRIVGQGRAAELVFTGRTLPGGEAERWGFFNRLCEPDTLLIEAQALARTLADGPTFANAITKRMLHKEWDMGIDAAIESEAQAQALCMQTADFAEAYAAFVAKRPPRFQGR